MRPLILLLLGTIGGLNFSAPAEASSKCPSSKPVFETADRCRATYIDVLTGNRQWISVKEGQRVCFVPGEQVWEWKCRGYTEATRCRRIRSKKPPTVKVEVRGGEVFWSCYER